MNLSSSGTSGRVNGYREARLDQVLAQELYADRDFATWLWNSAGEATQLELVDTMVQMNRDDTAGFPADSHGETDVHCTLVWSDGSTSQLFIENKVWAGFQPRQPERYRQRADHVGGRALLVAPSGHAEAASEAAKRFHGRTTIEDIARWFATNGGRRQQWIAQLLAELLRPAGKEPPPDDEGTVTFTKYCVDWLASRTPLAIPAPMSLHTAAQGWLDFETPSALVYKVTGIRKEPRGSVDLYLKHLPTDEDQVLQKHAADPCVVRDGATSRPYLLATDTKGNRLLRFEVDKLAPTDGKPAGDSLATLHLALEACAAVAEWVDRLTSTDAWNS